MPCRIVLTAAAKADILDALDWYSERAPTVIPLIRAAQRGTFRRIATNPQQFPAGAENTRHALLRQFPYVVVFRVADNTAYIIAFFHTSRDPRHWQRRASL
jgi:plasmid stabilization system protein ParE